MKKMIIALTALLSLNLYATPLRCVKVMYDELDDLDTRKAFYTVESDDYQVGDVMFRIRVDQHILEIVKKTEDGTGIDFNHNKTFLSMRLNEKYQLISSESSKNILNFHRVFCKQDNEVKKDDTGEKDPLQLGFDFKQCFGDLGWN